MNKRYTIKNILLATFWLAIGTGTVVLLISAIQKKDEKHCKGVNIDIKGVSNNFFVDKKDIQQTIRTISGGNPAGKPIGDFNLKKIELELQKDIWIKSAQLFFDNNEMLQVKVFEREPVARIFTTNSTTFYLDSSSAMLPLSDKFSARLPVFTNFPTDKKVLLKADSVLLKGIIIVSEAIQADPFLMAMIDQVDITPQRTFELVPKFGNMIIVLGDASDVTGKFNKLQTFYKDVVVKAGWNKYSVVDVQYHNQVVAIRKDAKEVAADSVQTLHLMKIIADNAERMSADTLQVMVPDNENNTTNKNLIQQSIERDDNNSSANTIEKPQPQGPANTPAPVNTNPVKLTKPVVTVPAKTPAAPKKNVSVKASPVTAPKPKSKPAAAAGKPKVTMPKPVKQKPNNEYEN